MNKVKLLLLIINYLFSLNFALDINKATVDDLVKIGLPKAVAENIVEYRTKNGNFNTIYDILKVNQMTGILFAKIKDKLEVLSNKTTSKKNKIPRLRLRRIRKKPRIDYQAAVSYALTHKVKKRKTYLKPKYIVRKILAYLRLGDYKKALKYIKLGEKYKSKFNNYYLTEFNYLKAAYYELNGKVNKALMSLTFLDKRFEELFLWRKLVILYKLGRMKEMKEVANELLKKYPDTIWKSKVMELMKI